MIDTKLANDAKNEKRKQVMYKKITIYFTKQEYAILAKKASSYNMTVGELGRMYLLQSDAFDTSFFDSKKARSNSRGNKS